MSIQTELYRETYIRAYRMRHPRHSKLKVVVISLIVITVLFAVVICVSLSEKLLTVQAKKNETEKNAGAPREIIPEAVSADFLLGVTFAPPHVEDTIPPTTPISINPYPDMDYQQESIEPEVPTITDDISEIETAIEPEFPNVDFTNDEMSPIEEEVSDSIDGTQETMLQTGLRSSVTEEELIFIEQVVEAEVTGTTYKYNGQHVNEEEMLLSKIRVAQVFLNRVDDMERFSHITTLYEAVSEPGASSTVGSGRCYRVTVTNLTKEAVQIALDPSTEDLTDGALFFLANGAMHNKYGNYLFTDSVGHSFFK